MKMATYRLTQTLYVSARLINSGNLTVKESLKISTRNVSYSRAPFKKISVPKMIEEKLKKLEKPTREDSHRLTIDPKEVFVISCKNREKNHRIGQKYKPGEMETEKIGYNLYQRDKSLASYGWGHRKSQGDYFILNAHGKNPATRHGNKEDVMRFDDLELSPELLECLARNNITTMTNVQKQSLETVLDGGNVLCAAETGSGKTLCYLVPIMQRILQQKQSTQSTRGLNMPYAVVALPSHELVQQVYNLVEMFSEYLPIRAVTVTGGQSSKREHKKEIDLIIGTPGAIRKEILRRKYRMSHVQTLVLDEGDTLLDSSFLHMTRFLIQKIGVRPEAQVSDMMTGAQCVIVCATKPRHMQRTIGDIIPLEAMTTVNSDYLHRLMPHVPQKFLRLHSSQKAGACLKLCKNAINSNITTMVFCNKNVACVWLDKFLTENNVSHLTLNGNIDPEERLETLEKFQSGENPLLICTDIASRGLDTTHVQHVVNFDFPLFMSDYIHRVGRVGRVGCKKTGYVLSFITQKWDVALVWEIETAARKMAALNKVDADIKAVINRIYEDKFGDEDQIDLELPKSSDTRAFYM